MDKRSVTIKWINKILDSEIGDEIWLLCHNKEHQKSLAKDIKKELDILKQINAKDAMQVQVSPVFRKQVDIIQLYIVLKRVPGTPFVGFKKGADGINTKIDLLREEENDT